MNGYRFELLCVHCPGTELTHVTAGRTTTTYTAAIARCPNCRTEYCIAVHLTHVRDAVRPWTDGRRKQLTQARQHLRSG